MSRIQERQTFMDNAEDSYLFFHGMVPVDGTERWEIGDLTIVQKLEDGSFQYFLNKPEDVEDSDCWQTWNIGKQEALKYLSSILPEEIFLVGKLNQ